MAALIVIDLTGDSDDETQYKTPPPSPTTQALKKICTPILHRLRKRLYSPGWEDDQEGTFTKLVDDLVFELSFTSLKIHSHVRSITRKQFVEFAQGAVNTKYVERLYQRLKQCNQNDGYIFLTSRSAQDLALQGYCVAKLTSRSAVFASHSIHVTKSSHQDLVRSSGGMLNPPLLLVDLICAQHGAGHKLMHQLVSWFTKSSEMNPKYRLALEAATVNVASHYHAWAFNVYVIFKARDKSEVDTDYMEADLFECKKLTETKSNK